MNWKRGYWSIEPCAKYANENVYKIYFDHELVGDLTIGKSSKWTEINLIDEWVLRSDTDLFSLIRQVFAEVNKPNYTWLSDIELLHVIKSQLDDPVIIGGRVDYTSCAATFVQSRGRKLAIPLHLFEESGDGTKPDFDNLSIEDYGNTVKFGEYEVSSQWIIDNG